MTVGQRLFDERVRTDSSPGRGEDSFSFLNRVDSPYWERVRQLCDRSFANYPSGHSADLRGRFRDPRWHEHVGAWWELYLFTVFRALGFRVEMHPELPGVASRPDFRVESDDYAVLVEARFVTSGLFADNRVGRNDWITEPLDELTHRNFMVAVRIIDRGTTQPRREQVTRGVLEWLDEPG